LPHISLYQCSISSMPLWWQKWVYYWPFHIVLYLWSSGSACIVVGCSILWKFFYFSSCGMYELIQHKNSYIRWIQYEFIYFLHFKYVNSYKYEFILCMNLYIFLQLSCMNSYIFALQNKCCKHAQAASVRHECAAQATRAKPELTSCPNHAVPGCPDW
jgi:hypothetical protein